MRQERQLKNETKQLISNALKGRHLSEQHKQHISTSMKKYWAQIPFAHNKR